MHSTGKRRAVDAIKKTCEDANNARNRDAFAITKANGMLKCEKEMIKGSDSNRSTKNDEVEDAIIAAIDMFSIALQKS